MRVLLDTQLVLWAMAEPQKLPLAARREIEEAQVFVSAASLWEIAIKAGLGKLTIEPEIIRAAIVPSGFDELPVTGAHAARVKALPWHHRDHFDRLLVAQALAEPLILLTVDRMLAAYGDGVRVV